MKYKIKAKKIITREDLSIDELENKIFKRIENPLGKSLLEIAQTFDTIKNITQDFKKSVDEKELMSEFVKSVQYLNGNMNYDHPEVHNKCFNIQKIVIDMMKHDNKYLNKFIDMRISYANKNNEGSRIYFEKNPEFHRELMKRVWTKVVNYPEIYNDKEKHSRMLKSEHDKLNKERNEQIVNDFAESKIDKDIDHNEIMDKYNELKALHPEWDERKLLEEAFNAMNERGNE